MRKFKLLAVLLSLSMGAAGSPAWAADTLRLLTWGSYAPENIIEMFQEETGIEVEVTFSNNEEMISKLRATGGGGFDLAQPSHDRIHAAQLEYNIYKPMDLSQIDTSVYDPSLLGAGQGEHHHRRRGCTRCRTSGELPGSSSTRQGRRISRASPISATRSMRAGSQCA